jgi:hypothetical protein
MSKRWLFIEHTQHSRTRWTWRLLRIEGSIEQHSAEFESYGAAVRDALINGFSPAEDHWIIESRHAVVHYEHGQHSLVVPKKDNHGRRVPSPAPSRRTTSPKKRSSDKEGR